MKVLFICLLSAMSLAVHSQPLHIDLYAGAAHYQGDLQTKKFDLSQSNPAFGLGLSYGISRQFTLRGAANFIKIEGSDETGDAAKNVAYRNLSFQSNVWEAQLAMEFNLLDIEERGFAPYIFAGVAAFHFNPYAFDNSHNKVFLRPLTTEGQGLAQYPEKKLYANNQIALPFGGGIKFALSDQLQVGIEIGLRKLFTDYLDDVSGTYADSSLLSAARGPQAIAFAYRGREIHGSSRYPTAGNIRGNPQKKDWYYTTGLKISYVIAGKGGNGARKSQKGKLGCPTNVY
jgi:opacity protein-like surface antigen